MSRTADDLLPCVCYVLLQSAVPNIYTHLGLVESFLDEASAMAVEGYMLTQFQVALKYLMALKPAGSPRLPDTN